MLESTFHEDWDEIGSNRAKKGHLLLKSTIFSKLAGCQWVLTAWTDIKPLSSSFQLIKCGTNNLRYNLIMLEITVAILTTQVQTSLASGVWSKTRPAWQSLARPGFPGFWPSLPGKCGLVKPGKPGHGHVFLATLATKVRLSRPC